MGYAIMVPGVLSPYYYWVKVISNFRFVGEVRIFYFPLDEVL